MTTHRKYEFACPSTELEQARLYLLAHCERFSWYEAPYVRPSEGGFSFGFTVHARDQWWCHQRAMRLATEVYEALQLSLADMSVPLWTAPEPHTNRGYSRDRAR